MMSQLAKVFSSQGVLIQGTRYAPAGPRSGKAAPGGDPKAGGEFGALFDQASAKLELSKQAQGKKADGTNLSDDEKKQVEEMAKRDREVRAHEQAHMASAGGVARGGANYEYQSGPDGKNYAVGGHVDIDASPVEGNPEATLEKAQKVQRAALAPSDPSGQDRSVAAAAAQMAIEARKEMNEGQADETAAPRARGPYARPSAASTGRAFSAYA